MKKFGKGSSSKDKKKAAKEAPAGPQTWEEYMEEGVLLEEKGERYGTGDKARRFYEKAADMYNKACKLNPQDSDCLYNFGRVLYILVDFTHSPCQKLALLNASIERFRSALIYDAENTDTLFNLGQALTTHAEVIQDHDEEEDDEDEEHDHSHGDHDDHFHGTPEERAAAELEEAVTLFDTCYSIQQRELYDAVQEARSKTEEDDEKKPAELIEQELQELSSSAGVLIDTLISASAALTSLAFLVGPVDRSHAYYKEAAEKLEIALGVANDRVLWPASEEESASSSKGKGRQDDAEPVESDDILPATKPVSTFREAESQSDVVSQKEKICEIHLQYSNLLSSQTDRNFQDTGKISEELYEKSLKHLNVVLRHHPRQIEALCDKGDLLGSWAQGLATFEQGSVGLDGIDKWDTKSLLALGTSDVVAAEPAADIKEGKTDRASRIWQLFASATRAFLLALEVEPQNTSILEKLGDIHWSRSLLTSPVALKNRPMLLNNASVYYRFAWESCKDGSAEDVDEEQRLEVLLSWAQVLMAIPGKDEEVIRVLKQWKRIGGEKEMLEEMLEGNTSDILQEDFLEFAVQQFTKGL
ncbi:hypothetical protein BGX23_008871 [Mortierella sp. AD031]|nr:hypothetical protein BGX23_008871 [Mortierella sp. AD031]